MLATLKGNVGGQLLCAIGNDGNDNMLSIVYAIALQVYNFQ
jgi:hypothetical protein